MAVLADPVFGSRLRKHGHMGYSSATSHTLRVEFVEHGLHVSTNIGGFETVLAHSRSLDNWSQLALHGRDRYLGRRKSTYTECYELAYVSVLETLPRDTILICCRNVTCTIAGDSTTETGILQGYNCAYYVSRLVIRKSQDALLKDD